MTTQQILKLDAIKRPEDLTWRKESYDAGHPKCLCSACGELVTNFAIRLYDDENNSEAAIHVECFQFLNERGILKTL